VPRHGVPRGTRCRGVRGAAYNVGTTGCCVLCVAWCRKLKAPILIVTSNIKYEFVRSLSDIPCYEEGSNKWLVLLLRATKGSQIAANQRLFSAETTAFISSTLPAPRDDIKGGNGNKSKGILILSGQVE